MMGNERGRILKFLVCLSTDQTRQPRRPRIATAGLGMILQRST
jgi:hypothetical protein